MLRILFSRLGQPHTGPPNAYSFNVPSVRASGAITVERGAGAGHDGGRIVFEGTPADLVSVRVTLTAEHLAAYVGA